MLRLPIIGSGGPALRALRYSSAFLLDSNSETFCPDELTSLALD
jgi:hypothetical protein